MPEPVIIPRSDHPISRQQIDADALKVLYRLRQFDHIAYLVGGSVRDLLLGRTPKDFDIGTSAHPYQVKRLFRNCWIIGRRFRLAHVKFGMKVIEVATFRRQVPAGTEEEPTLAAPIATPPSAAIDDPDLLIQHDNTFGTPEEDAFRRDFTLNALFYDIETRSIIDYVGGLDDIRAGLIRCIGVPEERFQEDPVRMLRAVALAARLDFRIDGPLLQAVDRYRGELARSAPARLMEEIYKVMRAGAAEKTFRMLVETGLLAALAPEVPGRITDTFWQSLAAIDNHRRAFKRNPESLSNAILLGSLLIPLGLLDQHHGRTKELGARFGILPLARRDVEFLRQILQLQRHLRDPNASARHKRGVMHRTAFPAALLWLELHGNNAALVESWRALQAEAATEVPEGADDLPPLSDGPPRRRRRRRRRRRYPTPGGPA
ncbi:MAG TPA: polynucleotide adenylyltransferase PcnB [Vicinamibacterales bacterium]|nr:polynucleotide adenylyltransferase PcnB [Vicinamibacterales bacterium]